jgi:hypothetical protein
MPECASARVARNLIETSRPLDVPIQGSRMRTMPIELNDALKAAGAPEAKARAAAHGCPDERRRDQAGCQRRGDLRQQSGASRR